MSRVPSSSLQGSWWYVSVLRLPWPREVIPMRLQREWNVDAVWGRHQDTVFLRLLGAFQALLGIFVLVGGRIIIHDTHILNTVRPMRPEVSDEETSLQLSFVPWRGAFELVLPSMYGATRVDFGVVRHVCGGEGLACKFYKPITEIIMTLRDEASLIAVEGISDVKCRSMSITMFR